MNKCSGCGVDFDEFPELRHAPEDCPGPECTCYEGPGHQPGCPYGASLRARHPDLPIVLDPNPPGIEQVVIEVRGWDPPEAP